MIRQILETLPLPVRILANSQLRTLEPEKLNAIEGELINLLDNIREKNVPEIERFYSKFSISDNSPFRQIIERLIYNPHETTGK